MLPRPVLTSAVRRPLAVTALSAVLTLAVAGCASEPAAPSTSESASLPGNIPAELWNQGTPDPLRPVGLAGITPTEPLVATSYDEGTDIPVSTCLDEPLGDRELLHLADHGTMQILTHAQRSSGSPLTLGKVGAPLGNGTGSTTTTSPMSTACG